MNYRFEITFPEETIVLSPNFYIGEADMGRRPFVLTMKLLDKNQIALGVEETNLTYSENLQNLFVYLNESKDDPRVLTSPQVRLKRPVSSAEFTLSPWKLANTLSKNQLKNLELLFITGRGSANLNSWTIFKRGTHV